ncbi:hypothetical protein Ac2012v2_007634 [Leucoagaricus gongylophorus]
MLSAVQHACTQFEYTYTRPTYHSMRDYFDQRPIISTFVTIFTLLSLIPIVFFVGTSLFVLITFILTALFVALSASLGIILFCCTFHCSPLFPTLTQTVGFLALVLFGILLASLFLTVAALMSYSFIRLALHIQREGPWNGVSEWQRETRNSLLTKQNNVTRFDRIVKKEEQEPSPTDVSEPGRGEAVEVKKS